MKVLPIGYCIVISALCINSSSSTISNKVNLLNMCSFVYIQLLTNLTTGHPKFQLDTVHLKLRGQGYTNKLTEF